MRSTGSCSAISLRKRSRPSATIFFMRLPRLRRRRGFAPLDRATRIEVALDVELEDVHEVLRVGDDTERLMRAAVLQLADHELGRVDTDRCQLAKAAVGLGHEGG